MRDNELWAEIFHFQCQMAKAYAPRQGKKYKALNKQNMKNVEADIKDMKGGKKTYAQFD